MIPGIWRLGLQRNLARIAIQSYPCFSSAARGKSHKPGHQHKQKKDMLEMCNKNTHKPERKKTEICSWTTAEVTESESEHKVSEKKKRKSLHTPDSIKSKESSKSESKSEKKEIDCCAGIGKKHEKKMSHSSSRKHSETEQCNEPKSTKSSSLHSRKESHSRGRSKSKSSKIHSNKDKESELCKETSSRMHIQRGNDSDHHYTDAEHRTHSKSGGYSRHKREKACLPCGAPRKEQDKDEDEKEKSCTEDEKEKDKDKDMPLNCSKVTALECTKLLREIEDCWEPIAHQKEITKQAKDEECEERNDPCADRCSSEKHHVDECVKKSGFNWWFLVAVGALAGLGYIFYDCWQKSEEGKETDDKKKEGKEKDDKKKEDED